MLWIAIRMLTGDARKYAILVASVAFAALLIMHQSSIFWGVMQRTVSQIRDVHPDGIWVMDPALEYLDEARALPENAIYRVRGVPGVAWACRLYKGSAMARTAEGRYRQVVLLGLDEPALVGRPEVAAGNAADLRLPDAVIVDEAGYGYLWPSEPLATGRILELNDHRAAVVGICQASPPFQTLPIVYCTFNNSRRFGVPARRYASFILAEAGPESSCQEVCERITQETGLLALSGREFMERTIRYYFRQTGIPLNFIVVVAIGVVVGVAICGQTFYLFTSDHLKQFATFKALRATNRQLAMMVLWQGFAVGVAGFAIGGGTAVMLIEGLTANVSHLRGFYVPWQVLAGTGVAIVLIMAIASCVSVRRVLNVEAAAILSAQ